MLENKSALALWKTCKKVANPSGAVVAILAVFPEKIGHRAFQT